MAFRRRQPRVLLSVGVTVLLALGLGPTNFGNFAVAQDREEAPEVGAPAPAFTLPNLEGEEVSLEDFRGKGVLINFWATWCGPCREEIPALQEFYETYGDRVVVLGIDIRESPSTVRRFVEARGITYPILLDTQGRVAARYEILAIPSSFFVDEDGIIREVIRGALNTKRLAYTFARKVYRSDLIPLGVEMTATEVLDADGDGSPEAELLDADGDGRPDGGRIDVDGDGTPEAEALVYKNVARGWAPLNTVETQLTVDLATGGAIVQWLKVDLDGDTTPEIYLEDRDFDGRPDVIALDPDDDGAPELQAP